MPAGVVIFPTDGDIPAIRQGVATTPTQSGAGLRTQITGGVVTITGTLTAPRTLTLPDAAITIPAGTLLTGTLANANRLDSTSGAGVVKESQIADAVTGSVLTIAGTLTAPRTLSLPDAAVTIPTGTLLTGTLANANRLDSTSAAGIIKESLIADGIATSVLTLSGTLTAPRTQTVQDLAGTIPLRDAGTKDGIFDWSSGISVTGAVTATAGRLHVCTGTTADYTVTLPAIASTIGQSMAFVMGSALTRLVTLDANAAELIDGALIRIMWANEVAVIYNNGTQWVKVGGKSLPMAAAMRRQAVQSVAQTTWAQIVMDTTAYDTSSALALPCADLTNGRFKVLRPGLYTATGFCSLTGVTSGTEFQAGPSKTSATPNDNPNAFTTATAPSSTNCHTSSAGVFQCVAGDWLGTICYQGDVAARNTRAVATVYPSLSVTEVPQW